MLLRKEIPRHELERLRNLRRNRNLHNGTGSELDDDPCTPALEVDVASVDDDPEQVDEIAGSVRVGDDDAPVGGEEAGGVNSWIFANGESSMMLRIFFVALQKVNLSRHLCGILKN